MKSITLILTEDCNQSCTYCYQVKSGQRMTADTAFKAVDFLADHLSGTPVIKFYGGEPLLEYELIKRIIAYCDKKLTSSAEKPKYTMTINGSLLTKSRINELANLGVKVFISIDGMRHSHECARTGYDNLIDLCGMISLHPILDLNTVSVVTPRNARYLAESFYFLLSFDPAEMAFTIQYDREWRHDEIELLGHQYETIATILALKPVNKTKISLEGLQKRSTPGMKALNECGAGEESFTVRPDGSLHGCLMFVPWSRQASINNTLGNFSNLAIGNINSSSESIILRNMSQLQMNDKLTVQFYKHSGQKHCRSCDLFMECAVCPAISLIHSKDPLYIPEWICRIKEAVSSTQINIQTV